MNDHDAYQAPNADLSAEPKEIRTIRELFDQQNGVLAVLAGAIACLAMTVIWSEASLKDQYVSLAFFIASGVVIGLLIRVASRPVATYVRYISLYFYLYACALAVMIMGVPLTARASGPFLAIVFLLVAGGWAAFMLARRSLTDEQKSAVWYHGSIRGDVGTRLRNRLWLAIVMSVLSSAVVLFLCGVWLVYSGQIVVDPAGG